MTNLFAPRAWVLATAALLLAAVDSLKVSLRTHDKFMWRAQSFLSLGSTSRNKIAYYRALHNNTHAIEYYGHVEVGGQQFSVIFDSGSDQLLLPGASCVSAACQSHRRYGTGVASLGSLKPSDFRTVTFGSGQAVGVQQTDLLCIGGKNCANIRFLETLEESDEPFLHARFDGVLGLSLPLRRNATAQESVLRSFVDANVIRHAMFAVFLAKDVDAETSEISFGSADPDRMLGAATWVPVSEPGYWQFSLVGLDVGGTSLGLCKDAKQPPAVHTKVSSFYGRMCCRSLHEFEMEQRCQYYGNSSDATSRSRYVDRATVLAVYPDGRVAVNMSDGCVQKVPRAWLSFADGCMGDGTIQAVLDTGSSLIMGPRHLVDTILTALRIQENCTAQRRETFPSLSLSVLGGQRLTLNSSDYMDTLVTEDGVFCWPHFIAMPETAKGSTLVLGMPFLRAFYTIFDAENYKIGFAEPRQSSQSSSSPAGRTRPSSRAPIVALRGWRPNEAA